VRSEARPERLLQPPLVPQPIPPSMRTQVPNNNNIFNNNNNNVNYNNVVQDGGVVPPTIVLTNNNNNNKKAAAAPPKPRSSKPKKKKKSDTGFSNKKRKRHIPAEPRPAGSTVKRYRDKLQCCLLFCSLLVNCNNNTHRAPREPREHETPRERELRELQGLTKAWATPTTPLNASSGGGSAEGEKTSRSGRRIKKKFDDDVEYE
jgi:hypothetical protein